MVVTWTAVAGVAVIAFGLVVTPGPNMIYLVSRSVSQGRAAGLISLAGVAVGFLCYLLAAVLGISAVFLAVPALYTTVKLLGAAYLLWLAWTTLRPGGRSVFAVGELPVDRTRRLFLMGLMTNLLNPKIAVLYIALIPQFVDPGAGRVWLQSLILGAVQIGVALSVNAVIVILAGAIAAFLANRPRWLRVQRFAMGSVLGLLAVKLAVDDNVPAASPAGLRSA
ncbi:LysE family translocator [Kribbella sp. NPDC048915]|uniref:LysE family translocator n=1 Tax=Kribbella sp. NPDC048915 TaxID=3155148 RepID=UPI0033D6C415